MEKSRNFRLFIRLTLFEVLPHLEFFYPTFVLSMLHLFLTVCHDLSFEHRITRILCEVILHLLHRTVGASFDSLWFASAAKAYSLLSLFLERKLILIRLARLNIAFHPVESILVQNLVYTAFFCDLGRIFLSVTVSNSVSAINASSHLMHRELIS